MARSGDDDDFLLRVVGISILAIVGVFGIAVLADVLEQGYEVPAGFYVLMSAITGGLGAVLVARFKSNGRRNGNGNGDPR